MGGFSPNLIKKIFDKILLHKQAPFVSAPVSCKQALIKIPGGRWRLNDWVPHLMGHLLGKFWHGSLLSRMLRIASVLKIVSNFHFGPKTVNFGPGIFFFLAFGQICHTFGLPKHQTLISAQNGPIWADPGSQSGFCRYAVKMKSDEKKMCRLDL